MATPAFFGNGYLQFGRESTWGTEVNAARTVPCKVLDFQGGRGKIRSQSMSTSRTRPALYAGGHRARAVVEIEMQYVVGSTDPSGFLMLHDAIFGYSTGTSFGSYGATVSGTGPYSHTFVDGNLGMNSLTLELGDGKPNSANKCILLLGAKVTEAVWAWGASYEGDDNVLTLRLTLVGKSSDPNADPTGSLTAQTIDPIMAHHCTTITDGWQVDSLAYNVTVTHRSAILEDGYVIGTQYIREPVFSEFATCEIEMTVDFDSYTQLDAFLDHTASTEAIAFTFTKPGQNDQYVLRVDSGKAYIVDHQHPLTAPGIVRQTLRIETVAGSSGESMECVMVSTGCDSSDG